MRSESRLLKVWIAVVIMSFVSLGGIGWSPADVEAAPPRNLPHPGRSAVIAKNGIVATSHPLAAQAGLDILKAGGNAADAAIAASAMIGLVEPMSCGIGGDLFVIYWDSKTKRLHGLNACGRSPFKLTREVFAKRGMGAASLDGAPGGPSG